MDLKKYINKDTIYYYAKTNEKFIKAPIKGIALEFPGLGGGSCLGGLDDLGDYDTDFAKQAAEAGVVLAYVYTGPWSWMNTGAVRVADAVVDALKEKYNLGDVPVTSSGGSMGGLGSLIYAASTRHKLTACVAACPCCDALDRYDAADEFRKTFVTAVAGYDCENLEDAMKTISPMHRLDDMPFIPYFIANCCEDEVFPDAQLEEYVAKLKEKGHDVDYVRMEGMTHGQFTEEGINRLREFQLKWYK